MAKEWLTRYPCDPHYYDWLYDMQSQVILARIALFYHTIWASMFMFFLIAIVFFPYGLIIDCAITWGFAAILTYIIWYLPVPFENLQNFTLIQDDE